ncbi:MAG: hypothetical protein GKR89_04940 [Candidatus Latescibacteria bacterium]|nr:hypothetical protein [Candidatus Latescibacterota bacterium]
MERIFANLFRISAPRGKTGKGLSHTYFLKRKKGNILISHKAVPTPEDLAEIEAMGGIESQWVCHTHDLLRGSSHKKLHAQFGCTLHYHGIERPHVEKKIKCPTDHHGNEGLQYGSDFEVFYWPTCTSGHCIFRWRSQGKYYLFTSHSIFLSDNEWKIDTNKWHLEDLRPQLARLRKLRMDYVFPGYSLAREIGFYRLNDQTRKSFAKALKAVA